MPAKPPESITDRKLNDRRIECEIGGMIQSCLLLKEIKLDVPDLAQLLKNLHLASIVMQDIISRLCKLSDRTKSTLTFDRVSKYCSASIGAKSKDPQLASKLTIFKNRIVKIEPHRNLYVAHLNANLDKGKLFVESDLTELIDAVKDAIEIWDFLNGKKVEYMLTPEIDLRIYLFGDGTIRRTYFFDNPPQPSVNKIPSFS